MDNRVDLLFKEYDKVGKENEITLEHLEGFIGKHANSIVLYGAGSAGIAFMQYLRNAGFSPVAFTDGDPKKWGTYREGLEIISPEDIKKKVENEPLIIVTINTDGKRYCKSFEEALRVQGHTGVYARLHELGYKQVIDYTYFRRVYRLFIGDKYNLPSCSDVFLMSENREKIKVAFNLLSDEKSKEIFLKIIRFRILDDSVTIPTLSQDNQYFEYEIYNKVQNEHFVDCGAYNGNSLKTFLRNNQNVFKHYTAFEPDYTNAVRFRATLKDLEAVIAEKITFYPFACSEKMGQMNLYCLDGPGSFVADIGNQQVESIALDSVLLNEIPTMIKMNIEGSEISALKGAKRIISEHYPVLAIAGYHKTWDLWDIPLLINKYYEDYNFYLCSYMNHISFVYYAVPKKRIVRM